MIDLTAIPSYTDAQLLAAFRYGLLQLAISEEVTIAGRTVRRSQLEAVRETITWLELRILAAGDSGGGIALATLQTQNPGSAPNQIPTS